MQNHMPLKEVPENTIANSLKSEYIKLPNQKQIQLDIKWVEHIKPQIE